VLAVATISLPARAQVAQGFALDRFNPSERGSEWFAGDSLDLRGVRRPAFGVVGDFAFRPLVLQGGGTETAVVRVEYVAHVGGSVVLWDRVRLAASMPLVLHEDGDSAVVGSAVYPAPGVLASSMGDLRLSADARIFGAYGDAITLAVGLQAFLPSGDRSGYVGDGSVRFVPHLLVAGSAGKLVYSANIGFHVRTVDDVYAGAAQGSELVAGASAGLRLADGRLVIGPEIFGATGTSSRDAFGALHTTPIEALFGAHYVLGDRWRVGAGVGRAGTHAYGEPDARVLFSIEFAPKYAPPAP
jgi:hypothetical protein